MKINRTYLILLMWAGIIEGISTLALFFVAMPLKYMYDQPMAVTYVGMIHGFLFIGLIALFVIGKSIVPLSTKMVVGGIIGAVLPFGPFIVDVKLYKLLRS
jgi:integral membrane protein